MRWEDTENGLDWSKQYHKEYYKKNKAKLLQMQKENTKKPGVKERKTQWTKKRHKKQNKLCLVQLF